MTKLRKTQKMQADLTRSELIQVNEELGFWVGQLLQSTTHFIADIEKSGNWKINLENRFPSYIGLKEQVQQAEFWLDGGLDD